MALLPGSLTPRLQEMLVRVSTWLPSFAKAAAELAFFTQVDVSRATACRLTEAAGAAAVAVQAAAVATILREDPVAAPAPEPRVFHVDGAMVPLRDGVWGEVKTLAVGVVAPPVEEDGERVVQTGALSYFSRMTESTAFADAALGELHRRGVLTAKRVGVVVDGAEWIQGFIDLHAPDAVRILDFPHAAEYVTAIGQTVGADGPLLSAAAVAQHLHTLKHDGPDAVLAQLRQVVAAQPTPGELPKQLAYLEKRVAQMQYPEFQAAGWPIGSGSGESANKLVVEARLKGAGMHWAVKNVNPLLALRNAVCNDRWDEVWSQIEREQRGQMWARRMARHQQRRPLPAPLVVSTAPRGRERRAAVPVDPAPAAARAPALNGRPAADHPWRRAWSRRQQCAAANTA